MPSDAGSGRGLRRAGGTRAAVGFDGRLSSPSLEKELVRGLTEAGVDVVRVGLGPTPMLYYAEADAGGGWRHPDHRQPQSRRV